MATIALGAATETRRPNEPRWRGVANYFLVSYKRTWRGTVVSSVVEPVLFLAAMGLGLGTHVHGGGGHGDVDGVRYIAFLAPGLLAAGALQTAVGQASWPVLGAVKWTKSYTAMGVTPLTSVDIALGHLAFMVLRIAMNAAIFLVVMAAFGTIKSPMVILALPTAIVTGAAIATLVAAFSIRQERDSNLSLLYRFGLIPLFLFSGTFFPVSQLPTGIQPIAWITPLWHGVALCRDFSLGRGSALAILGHIAYLLGLFGLGWWLMLRSYAKRLTW